MNTIKPTILFLFVLSFSAIAFSSCNLVNSNDKIHQNKEGVYEGIYLQGVEDHSFNPCIDKDESWLPLFTEETFTPIRDAMNDAQTYRVFVKAKGIPSEEGDYQGFLAEYNREFEITEIIKAIAIDSGKCP